LPLRVCKKWGTKMCAPWLAASKPGKLQVCQQPSNCCNQSVFSWPCRSRGNTRTWPNSTAVFPDIRVCGYTSSHSCPPILRPMIASTCRTSMRICGTEYSALAGIVCRCAPNTMNWWRVPEYGPSKPRARSLRMNSRRLSGRQAAMLHFVEINAGNDRQLMAQSQPDENPIFQSRAQLVFAFSQ
jgi:hypothetical protein